MSTESIASSSPPLGAVEPCRSCGAPMAEDQRYCLECGERRGTMSSVLLGGPPLSPAAAGPPATPPSAPRDSRGDDAPSGNAVTVIAGVGVLLLALGVGVLIGRSGGSKPSAPAAAQVISVSTAPAGSGASGGAGATTETPFSEDWPAATSGYTVQLQTLTQAGTPTSAVQSAKSAAAAKGAKGVGALLKGSNYVIYSGVYHKQAEAQKALAGLKKTFPTASVIKVAGGGSGAASSGAGSKSGSPPPTSGGSGGGQTATPKSLEELHKSKGKSYEEKSKNLPDVVGT
jgi:hypothetical protein